MITSKKPTLLEAFLIIYFNEIEKKLNQSDNKINEIKFQSEEANTDEFLKIFFKEFISLNNNINETNIKNLVVKIDNNNYEISTKDVINYRIVEALLPTELTESQKKNILDNKKSVYTNPDLYLKIFDGKDYLYESVELKSTKNNNIPGSSVQQVSPYEWVIFIKRGVNSVKVTTGYYLNSITNKLPFPDRSPRPQIGFNTLENWNSKYRKENNQNLIIKTESEINFEKIKLLEDWQEFLTDEWIEIIKAENIKNNEKWFNNAIRKFSLKLLKLSQSKSEEENQKLIDKLNKLIRGQSTKRRK